MGDSEELRRVAQGAVLAVWGDMESKEIKAALELERGAALRGQLEVVLERGPADREEDSSG